MARDESEQQALLSQGVSSPPPFKGQSQADAPAIPNQIVVTVWHDRPRCRFFKVLLEAILVACVVKFVLLSALWPNFGGVPRWNIGPSNLSPDYPVPSDVNLISCDKPLKSANPRTTLSVDPSSDIYHMAMGSMLHGTVRITTGKHDSVRFHVALDSSGREEDTLICSFFKRDNGHGVGIFNPHRGWGYRRSVKYDIVVEFPENHPILNQFVSFAENSVYTIDDIKDKVFFKNLSLSGTKGDIYSKSVAAHHARFLTFGGDIRGFYNASDFLVLHSNKGKIDVDVGFGHVESSDPMLYISTSNGELKADIRLYDGTSTKSGSNFRVSTSTTNAPLDVSFLEAPLYSTLNCSAGTSNSPAEVTLDPTFEGQFSLVSSSLFTPVIHKRNVEDPYGKGRRRVVTRRMFDQFTSGNVSWGGESKGDGSVRVMTLNGRLTLNV